MVKKKYSLKKKIQISGILNNIESKINENKIIKDLDGYHGSSSAHVIGITGPPGVGKSSLINNLIKVIRSKKLSVAIIAIDPSSQKSKGALLGDRARFDIDPSDYAVFARSLASKDSLGGVSDMTYPYMIVLRSFFDILIIETVGVGQSEISIKNIADTVIFCVQPGSGDSLQFMKSGIIEIPDIICVTKNDLNILANNTLIDLQGVNQYFNSQLNWEIKTTSISSKKNSGFENLYKLIEDRWEWLNLGNKLIEIRKVQDIEWIKKTIIDKVGMFGYLKLKNKIEYKNKPFSSLKKIFEKIKIEII